ncbi:Hypothetical predicted protein [Olea europaea subsp. europaea]|uniref:Exocyst complex component EXOC6/Sec15 N-terminal domain-containing protein n=1 Tax=Olea europaea subsp. europaea TaxID=158383 RepID=A0A8S0UDU5_OLEEU|nr:Hypothetical predicted protein [Olea europaea subsp. europaea]
MSAEMKMRPARQAGEDSVLSTMVSNGEDLGPMVRLAFETWKPEAHMQRLKNVVRKKEVEIDEPCKLHYEDFILAVDELRGVLVDAEELKSELANESFGLQENCVLALDLCLNYNNHISEGWFYPALKAVDQIEKNYPQNIPVKAHKMLIEKRKPLIKSHIEKKVCTRVMNAEVRFANILCTESHQTFFALIAGCFIVEDRVLRTASGPLSPKQLETMWETDAAKITSILEEQFSHMDTASHLFLVKDYATLLGATLKKYGYESVDNRSLKSLPVTLVMKKESDYHTDVLIFHLQASDIMPETLIMKKESDYHTDVLIFHLQASDIMLAFAYIPSFSSVLPECCRIV